MLQSLSKKNLQKLNSAPAGKKTTTSTNLVGGKRTYSIAIGEGNNGDASEMNTAAYEEVSAFDEPEMIVPASKRTKQGEEEKKNEFDVPNAAIQSTYTTTAALMIGVADITKADDTQMTEPSDITKELEIISSASAIEDSFSIASSSVRVIALTD